MGRRCDILIKQIQFLGITVFCKTVGASASMIAKFIRNTILDISLYILH